MGRTAPEDSFQLTDILPLALSVGGILLFGALSIANSRFYERLGATPQDVGLGYANTLAQSIGFIFLALVPLLVGITIVLIRQQQLGLRDTQATGIPRYQRFIQSASANMRITTTVTSWPCWRSSLERC
jgi:hypothetical protein